MRPVPSAALLFAALCTATTALAQPTAGAPAPPTEAAQPSPPADPGASGPSQVQVQSARDAFINGRQLLKAGQCDKALLEFKVADAIMHVPTTRVSVADALNCLHRLVEARNTARSVAELPAPAEPNEVFIHARDRAAELARALDARIAHLSIALPDPAPPALAIALDQKPVEAIGSTQIDLDPGKHTLEASASAQLPYTQTFTLKEGESRAIQLQFSPLEADSSSAPSIAVGPVTWTGIAMTSVGLITGIVAGAITLSDASTLKAQQPVEQSEIDSAFTTSYVSTAGFALTGAGAATALIGLFLIDPSLTNNTSSAEVSVTPLVGPGFVGLRGAF